MRPVRRAAVVLSAVLLPWPLCLGLAQPPDRPVSPPIARGSGEPPLDAPTDSFVLPNDAQVTAKLEAAAEFIRGQEWVKTARVLQQVLDVDGDPMAVLGGDKEPRTVGAHAEAQRLLTSLPPAGRKVYQESEGPHAAEMLKEALKEKDEAKLAAVVRRYLYTDAGPDALEALAGLQYDAGRYRMAALSYQRWLELREAAEASPETLFRAADAFHRIGDKTHADVATKQLLDRLDDKGLTLGDRKLSRDDVQKELSKPIETSADWPIFGGEASRSAQREGAMPFLWRSWTEDTTIPFLPQDVKELQHFEFGVRVADLFRRASEKLEATHQLLVPSQFPIATSIGTKDGKKHALVLYRTHAGIAARDLVSGKMVGLSPIDGSLEWMMEPTRQEALHQWEQSYLGEQAGTQRPGILFENTTIGTISVDGDFAYTVADLAVPKPPTLRMQNFPGQPVNQFGWPQDLVDAISHNHLMAFDLSRDCKSMWTPDYFKPDAKESIPELSGCFFLGAPLPLDGWLFVLAEKDQQMRLIAMHNVKDAADQWKPKVDWVLPLGVSHDSKLDDDALRRITAAHIAYGDGVLVCPTILGVVVGVDPLQHTLLWAYHYRDKSDFVSAIPPGARVLPGGIIINPATGQQIQMTLPQTTWRDCAPIVQDGKVVLTAFDSRAVTCLDLKTGALRWTASRRDDDVYMAGVFEGRVLIVGKKSCRAYGLGDGTLLWTAATGAPAGQGAAADGVYYLPLAMTESRKAPEVCAIDLAKGKVAGCAKVHIPPDHNTEKPDGLGNLVFFGGALISQSTESITAYPLLKNKLNEFDAALAANPNDVQGLFGRAQLRLDAGQVADAIDDLQKVIDAKPPAELLNPARDALYAGLTQLLQNDFAKAEKYLPEYDEMCHVPGDAVATLHRRGVLLVLTGRGFEAEAKWKESLDAYAELAGLGDQTVLAAPDDPALRSSPSLLAKAGVAALLKAAPAEKRKELEDEIRSVLDKAKESKGDDGLRSFIAAFGPEADAGREARLLLAERLMQTGADGLGVEALLTPVAHSDDKGQAARAVEALARVSAKRGLLDDAFYYYRILDRDYGAVPVRDGKTGAELLKEIQQDKRFLPLFDKPAPLK
ncbi:MAG TPA: PQQ-binding-like beta-propeller repeat protein [Gemmataceae bacterium]|nr:PQQ-binding-like beta-propeller repeat protein [Gemmataceae bacterium]